MKAECFKCSQKIEPKLKRIGKRVRLTCSICGYSWLRETAKENNRTNGLIYVNRKGYIPDGLEDLYNTEK